MGCSIRNDDSNYVRGRANEEAILRYLQSKNWTGTLSDGSRSPADLVVFNPILTKYAIQAKLRKGRNAVSISKPEIKSIHNYAVSIGAVPIAAVTTDDAKYLLSISTFLRHKKRPDEIVDLCGNFVAMYLDTGFICTMFNLNTGQRIGYDDLGGVNE